MVINSYSDIYKNDSSLRPYQQKAKKEIFESWDEVDNVMFQMPTGTGKTKLFTSIISDINYYSIQKREAVKILIVAHRTELINQIHKHLDDYHVPNNVIVGGKEKNYKYPVSVASIQTITNAHNIKEAKKLKVQFIIIDEAHHALAASYKKLWEMYPNAKRLGVTATPWRMNHQSFLDLFDKLVMSMPIKDFIRKGYLAPYKYYSLKDDSDIQRTIDDIELDRFGEYKESSMEEKMDIGKIRAQLLDSYLSLAKGKKGIIYAINIAHARHICEEYKNAGYNTVCIDSKTSDSERCDYVEKFKKSEIDIIVNVDIFSEGFDCPDIEFIQLARPTHSLVKYLQQVGRGLRPTANKQNCIILDNVGMYSRFGLPDARRHWKYHFIGKNVDDEPARYISKGTGQSRYVDLSEGTEDMELIQDVNDIVENNPFEVSSAINDFFPLFGITLGKTTWQQAKDMGYKVHKWEHGPSRTMNVEEVDFWDHEGEGIFTSLYWTHDESGFPSFWKSKGFDWNLSYDVWLEVFKKMGYVITITRQPSQKKYSRRYTLSAEFEALSPDKTLTFIMDFNYGENGYLTTSPKTLYSITLDYHESLIEEQNEASEEDVITPKAINEKVFNPMPLLHTNNYCDDNFVFWSDDDKHIYEAYIQDDTYYIISELIIDTKKHFTHRIRVGKIPMDSWMFWQMEREKVDNLKTVTHYGANYTLFHYQVLDKNNEIKNKYFDYKGREVDSPSVVKAKYDNAKIEGQLNDYIDVPVSIAKYSASYTNKKSQIVINRTLKRNTKPIAVFSTISDFGKYYNTTYSIYRSDAKSFSIRFEKDNKKYLYRFDLNGKLIHKGTVAGNEEAKTNPLLDSDIEKLWHVFDSKATSYKYFWFLSILQFYEESNHSSVIPYKNILAKMISNAWQYIFKEEGEFPKIDQIPKYIDVILAKFMLDDSSEAKEVEGQILYYYERSNLDHLLSPLLNNVPYRFLSPWIPFTSNDDVVAISNLNDARCLYSIQDDHITINPIWFEYLKQNYDKIESFIRKEIRIYLECKKVFKKMSINEFTKMCRQLQGQYREKMGEPMGYVLGTIPPKKIISMLLHGEKTGKNFVNKYAFEYAKRRVNNLQPHETISGYRLFNNMLSSQPMAFNLFCPFIQMLEDGKVEEVTRIFKSIFPDKYIGEVTEVGLEFLHTDIKNYLNDCTAMDAIIRYKDVYGKPSFIAIETKYTDVLSDNTSNKERAQDSYREWIQRISIFKPDSKADLLSGKKKITQIYRNFLLTECYGIVEKAGRCYSVVLAPAQHPTTEKEVASLKRELKSDYQYKISAVSLEDFIEKALEVCPREYKYAFLYFKERYIP